MEILAVVLGVWVLAAVAAALLIGRFLRVADRRERATTITAAGMPQSTRATARKPKARETA